MIALPLTEVFVPDGDEARRWAGEELAKHEYQAAKPTWFDEAVTAVVDWFFGLFTDKGAGSVAPIVVTLIVIVVIAALVVALLVWGRPRASRTVRRRAELLGERDDRTAAQLRAEAERRARERDWDEAIVLRYRALARALMERDLIDPAPGATAQSIARDARGPFPGVADRLHAAATAFDAVRYLRTPGDEAGYRAMAAVDDDLSAATPTIPDSTAVTV
ncbi:DUF4129 domain-containing protein [Microbacterium suwonense]|uniref:Protein-glutamine gamma-glutamyltransferase-like C-terminal domain-containing protein n=1 Tax=Microbacterium suwonense TaxID=683047 RepID=A0ABM8FSU6_9MICO|nr:DUF4129 domain-containing protein [Microbacterium suwonense]BDZ38748.1 hypothetical protein GCM10025863_13620 [Microbacterium suwonense]